MNENEKTVFSADQKTCDILDLKTVNLVGVDVNEQTEF